MDPLELWQYYVIDVAGQAEAFKTALTQDHQGKDLSKEAEEDIKTFAGRLDKVFELVKNHALIDVMALKSRFVTKVDIPLAVSILRQIGAGSDNEHLTKAFSHALEVINVEFYKTYDEDRQAIIDNLAGRIKFMRLEEGGPRLGSITKKNPISEPYFTRLDASNKLLKGRHVLELALANNGWVWAADPLTNFADAGSRVYLRRELISWGDCVKLRYGNGPDDNPFVWSQMEKYVTLLASIFDGLRIDNAHSTPIWVGERLLDAARRENPNIYVVAELFTGSAELDTHFVSRLGINSLIREMDNANEPFEESRLLYNYGHKKPVGSMDADILVRPGTVADPSKASESLEATIVPLQGSAPHALFMDLTHDNEVPAMKRTAEDALTMGSLVAFSWSAIGSTRGFDELYPDRLNIVSELRQYRRFDSYDSEGTGITPVRHVLNHLHTQMIVEGYSEGHLHRENEYIVFHRVHPVTHKGFVLVAHTAFKGNSGGRGEISPIILRGTTAKFLLGKWLEITGAPPKDEKYVHGFGNKLHDIATPEIRQGQDAAGSFSEIVVPEFFPPGSIMVFSTAIDSLPADPTPLEKLCQDGAAEAVASLSFPELNVLLYRASGEESDATSGEFGAYHVPGYGDLVFCGLEGFMSPLRDVIAKNELGHPLCEHLRQGTWALDYIVNRLRSYHSRHRDSYPNLNQSIDWFATRFDAIKAAAPPFMRPKYFSLIVSTLYRAARARALESMGPLVTKGDDFTQSLALVALQLSGQVDSASLTPFKPATSLAAGLPFFAAGWARLWGRDVLIALRGIYLATGLFDLAKDHILAFGATLHEGMIPNLLDSGKNPRYNCRDGPWYFAQCVQDYVTIVPQGERLLDEKVKRRFVKDGTWTEWNAEDAYSTESTVAELVTEILQRHAEGIHFREHNAGPAIDQDMRDPGFNIDVYTDWNTGFVMGGNAWNCGTWQDKNGSSEKAGNKGVPGSPRDGAAVEITGLLKSTLRWVSSLAAKGHWPAKGVQVEGKSVSFAEWDKLVQDNFEKHYWIPLIAQDDDHYVVKPELINRRGVYKDVYGSGDDRAWSDYQLRANFPIAMCVAPELFETAHALSALQAADAVLRGPLGMKTLDPSDWRYRGDYDNSNDSDDPSVAKGWNYHNGPEWVFPTGFFLRALLHFLSKSSDKDHQPSVGDSLHYVSSLMSHHRAYVSTDPWAGLPELTNHDGTFCRDSCNTQAWSASTLLDALREMSILHQSAIPPAASGGSDESGTVVALVQTTSGMVTAVTPGPASAASQTDTKPSQANGAKQNPTPFSAEPSRPPTSRRTSKAKIQSVKTPPLLHNSNQDAKSDKSSRSVKSNESYRSNKSNKSVKSAKSNQSATKSTTPDEGGEAAAPSSPSRPSQRARISSIRVPSEDGSGYTTTHATPPKKKSSLR